MATKKSTGPGALLLTPGAGADRDQHTLVAVDNGGRAAAVPPGRFPVPAAGQAGPGQGAGGHCASDGAGSGADRPRPAVDPDRLVLGGRSYGGRMCSMAVAEGLPAAGLILLSYPLHPPGKPENLRVEHFPDITVPVLLISGKSDPFGSPAEFDTHLAAIPGPVTQVWLTGGHDPRNATRRSRPSSTGWRAVIRAR